MNYRNILPLISHTQAFSTDYWNDFGYWNDGTFWYEKTPTYTARVTAYAAATGITDYTILDPLNIFDLGLTYYGLDTIMKAIYPMVTDKTSQSDMATQMKYNFMNPLDTNPAFRLNWVGGWVYSRTGALPNGTNAYADTNLIPSTTLLLNNTHITGYLRTNLNADAPILSSENASSYQNGLYIWPKRISLGFSVRINDDTSDAGGTNSDNILGFHILSRTSSSSKKYYLNNTIRLNATTISTGLNTSSIYIGASRNNPNYFNNQIAFSSIGDGLTDFQAQIFSTLVNNLQKALNRAVY